MVDKKAIFAVITAVLSYLLFSPLKNIIVSNYPEVDPNVSDVIAIALVSIIVYYIVKKLKEDVDFG